MDNANAENVRDAVREHYGKVAEADAPGCAPGCCGGGPGSSLKLGYSEEDLAGVPAGADLGLGCGNPQAIAGLRPGETAVTVEMVAQLEARIDQIDERFDPPVTAAVRLVSVVNDITQHVGQAAYVRGLVERR